MPSFKEFPVITPPDDPVLLTKLGLKLEEYKKKKDGTGRPWQGANLIMAWTCHRLFRDAFYKFRILSAVLESTGPVDTNQLAEKIFSELDSRIDKDLFMNAGEIVRGYTTGNLPVELRQEPTPIEHMSQK